VRSQLNLDILNIRKKMQGQLRKLREKIGQLRKLANNYLKLKISYYEMLDI